MSTMAINRKFALFESAFKIFLRSAASLIIILLVGMFVTLALNAWPSIQKFGISFIWSSHWDPVNNEYGALPFLVGTLLSSFIAILISTPFALAIAIFLGEYFKDGPVSGFVRSMIELLAGIPSVIYGFWALYYLVPIIRNVEILMEIPPYGVGVITASLVLSIMIIPYSAAVAREVISMVPTPLKEGAYAIGATQFEVIGKIVVPHARSGIFAGIILALGRALGETMAVTMVIGNMNVIPRSLFDPANTMASIIANEFTEATNTMNLSALIEIGLLLLIVSSLINIIGRIIIKKLGKS